MAPARDAWHARRMARRRTTPRAPKDAHTPHSPAHPAHTHAHDAACPECGRTAGIERAIETNDRMIYMLVVALCRQQGVEVYRKGSKTSLTAYVRSQDAAALDRLEARLNELTPKLDAALSAVLADFVREHTGFELRIPGER
jgi:hypothetical protein